MKYCVPYYKNFRYNANINEVILNYNDYRDSIIDEIIKQNWNEDQRIIIDARLGGTEEIIPILKMCQKNHNNLVIRIDIIQNDFMIALKEADIPFFFANHSNTADEIYGLIKRGVSDVYITESLAFNIAEVGLYCKNKGINVRVIPNIAQYKPGFKNEIPDPCKFFIRPEDVELYAPYVDVFEIIAPDDRLSVIYEIYRNEQWIGDLKTLIVGLEDNFYNSGLIPYFGTERLKCRQKCMQEKCNLCLQMKELADRFNKNQLEITREKKDWKYETESYKEAVRIAEKTTSNNNDEISEEQGIPEDN